MVTVTSKGSQKTEQSGPPTQISKADWDYERISRLAYELYEQRGRREGLDLKDWLDAERQLVAVSSK
jgi:outer membrane protein TolC